jgi:uncharacterized cupin superfamily protein
MMGRDKRPIGDFFGITQFGVNLTTLHPGAVSALHHQHTLQDEFVYVLAGEVTLYTGTQEHILKSGMCAGFRLAAKRITFEIALHPMPHTLKLEAGLMVMR